MAEQILISLPISEFKILLSEIVKDCLSNDQLKEDTVSSEIVDRAELCKRLNITEPTVIRWERKGKIPCFRIGNSVRYNWLSVLEKLEGKKQKTKN